MSQIAAEAVELPDHEHVALPQDPQAAVETRPVVAEAGGEVVVEVDHVVDARRPQGVALQGPADWEPSLFETRAQLAEVGPVRPAATRGGPAGPAVADRLREKRHGRRGPGPQVRRAHANHPAGHDDDRVALRRRAGRRGTPDRSPHRPERGPRPLNRKAATGGHPLSVGSRPLPQTTRTPPRAATVRFVRHGRLYLLRVESCRPDKRIAAMRVNG